MNKPSNDNSNVIKKTFKDFTDWTVADAIHSAEADNLTDIVILGYNPDGDFCIKTSSMSRAEGLWLLEFAKLSTMEIL